MFGLKTCLFGISGRINRIDTHRIALVDRRYDRVAIIFKLRPRSFVTSTESVEFVVDRKGLLVSDSNEGGTQSRVPMRNPHR